MAEARRVQSPAGDVFLAVFGTELGQRALDLIRSHCRDGQRLYGLGTTSEDTAFALGRQEPAIWIRESMDTAAARKEREAEQ